MMVLSLEVRISALTLFAALAWGASGCNPLGGQYSSSVVNPGYHPGLSGEDRAHHIVLVSGDAQMSLASTALPEVLKVKVVDSGGLAVAGVPLTFIVATGGGSVSPTTGLTGADGTLSTTWTLGSSAGAQTVVVGKTSGTLPGKPSSITFTATAIAGNISVANSTITGTGPVVANGVATSTVTITLRDASNNGVADIVPAFSASGTNNTYGACSATNPSGVSTCALTSTKAETKTLSITAPISKAGGNVTFTPGAATSLVFTQQPTGVAAGSPVSPSITVEARDALGNVVTGFGTNVVLAIDTDPSGGAVTLGGTLTRTPVSGVATFNNITLNKAFTGYKLSATAGSLSVVSVPFNVTPGTVSVAQSEVTANTSSILKGAASTVTLTAKDGYGNTITTGGLSVTFARATTAGQSVGTISSTTDLNNGTYTATYTGTKAGTANAVSATIGTVGTVTDTAAITVTNQNPILSTPADRLFPFDGSDEPLTQGANYSIDFPATDADTADALTFTCTYETVGLHSSDPNHAAAGTPCAALPSLVTSDGVTRHGKAWITFPVPRTARLNWQPTFNQRGTYKFTITVSDGDGGSDTEVWHASVRESYSVTNLLAGLDAAFSTTGPSAALLTIPAIPRLDGSPLDIITLAWLDLKAAFSGFLSSGFTATNPWLGNGTAMNPYQLAFSGSDQMNLGVVLSGQTKLRLSGWVKPNDTSTAAKRRVIANTSGTNPDFVLQHSGLNAQSLELSIGKREYAAIVQADGPSRYWRLNETAGTGVTDYSNPVAPVPNSGTLQGSYTVNQSSLTAEDDQRSMLFTNGGVAIGCGLSWTKPDALTVEAWFRPTRLDQYPGEQSLIRCGMGTDLTYMIGILPSGQIEYATHDGGNFRIMPTALPTPPIQIGNVHHIALVRELDRQNFRIYVDGEIVLSGATVTPAQNTGGPCCQIGYIVNGFQNIEGQVQEVAVYEHALTTAQIKKHHDAGRGIFHPNAIVAALPAGYWRLDERGGTTAYDLSGNANHGTYTSAGVTLGAPGAFASDSNTAASFDGGSGYLTVPHSASLATPDAAAGGKISGSAWIYLNAYDPGWRTHIMDKRAGAGGFYFAVAGMAHAPADQGKLILGDTAAVAYVLSNTPVTLNSWHHIAFSAHGSSVTFYLDGAADGTQSLSWTDPDQQLRIGAYPSIGYYINGRLDELAFFTYALTSHQMKEIFNGSAFNTCVTPPSFRAGLWQYVTALWDGTTSKLFLNGQEQCSVSPGRTFTPTTNLIVGASSSGANSWQGAVADIKVHGTSDGTTAAGTGTVIKNDFDATANRFRSHSLNTVKTGLRLELDASLASGGTLGYPAGCTSTDLSWFDLSPASLMTALTGFGACGLLSGWNGDGTPGNPYRLQLSGQSVKVYGSLPFTGPYSIESWFKSNNSWQAPVFTGRDTLHHGPYFGTSGGKGFLFQAGVGAITSNTSYIQDGWTHLTYTFDGTTGRMFLNGALDGTAAASMTQPHTSTVSHLGFDPSNVESFVGGISRVAVYDRALTEAEVRTNFEATVDRHRPVAREAIVTSGLMHDFDATFANLRMQSHSSGCAANALTWFQIGSSNGTGALENFSACGAASGWNGTGAATDPYRLSFDATDDRVHVPTSFPFTGPFTMETWFRSPGGPEIPMISTRPAGESHGLYFGLLTLQPFVYLENTTPVTLMTSSPITANAWTHMVFSFDGSKTTLYVNGAAKASGTATLSNPRTYTQAYLGNDPTNNEWFTGDISVVRFYSRGLSADEVLLNCNALKGRFQGAVCAP